jgi:hypothetical protein
MPIELERSVRLDSLYLKRRSVCWRKLNVNARLRKKKSTIAFKPSNTKSSSWNVNVKWRKPIAAAKRRPRRSAALLKRLLPER